MVKLTSTFRLKIWYPAVTLAALVAMGKIYYIKIDIMCDTLIINTINFSGFPGAAWSYWVRKGIVSGGQYGSKQGCRPYEISPCEHHVNGTRGPCSEGGKTPKCEKTCEEGYTVEYAKDKHFGKTHYSIAKNQDHIRQEIFENGPVEGAFSVYEDLLSYKEGGCVGTKR